VDSIGDRRTREGWVLKGEEVVAIGRPVLDERMGGSIEAPNGSHGEGERALAGC